MRDDIIKHLTSIHILKDHVVVVRIDKRVLEASNVGMMQQHDNSALADRSDLFRQIFGLRLS